MDPGVVQHPLKGGGAGTPGDGAAALVHHAGDCIAHVVRRTAQVVAYPAAACRRPGIVGACAGIIAGAREGTIGAGSRAVVQAGVGDAAGYAAAGGGASCGTAVTSSEAAAVRNPVAGAAAVCDPVVIDAGVVVVHGSAAGGRIVGRTVVPVAAGRQGEHHGQGGCKQSCFFHLNLPPSQNSA